MLKLALAIVLVSPLPSAQSLFVSGNGNGTDPILKAGLDGSNPVELVTGLDAPADIVVDALGGKLYWADNTRLQRSNLDGSDVEDVVTGISFARGIAVDSAAEHVYWTETASGQVRRADLDGTNLVVIASGLGAPIDVLVDPAVGRVFWNDPNNSLVQSSDLSGGDVQTLLSLNAQSIELDPAAQRLYYSSFGSIGVIDYAGGGQQTLLSGLGITTVGLTLDPGAGKLYWGDWLSDKVQRANLDGSDLEDLIVGPLVADVQDLALDLSVPPVASYCSTSPNSVGSGAPLSLAGSLSVSLNDCTLLVSGCPLNQFGIFYYGAGQTSAAFGDGLRCVGAGGGSLVRYPASSTGSSGTAARLVDFPNPPGAAAPIASGSTWNFQFWYRDPAAGGSGFNLSDALEITFCP